MESSSVGEPAAKKLKFDEIASGDGIKLEVEIFTGDPDGDRFTGEPEGDQFTGKPKGDHFEGDQFACESERDNIVGEPEGYNLACEPSASETPAVFNGHDEEALAASPLSSSPDDEPLPLAYDDEDLNEDAQCWLDSNYDSSKATKSRAAAAAAQPTGNNGESAAGETADGACTKGDDESASHSVGSRRQVYEKTVLVEKAKRFKNFNMLPDGWVAVTHDSGMPVYLHKELRVCTLSMPYFLGPGSVRKHDIPLAAVPCLEYRRAKMITEEPSNSTEDAASACLDIDAGAGQPSSTETTEGYVGRQSATSIGDCPAFQDPLPVAAAGCPGPTLPQAKVHVETAGDMIKNTSLSAEELHDYCKSVFEFTKIHVEKFPTWKERREHTRKHRPQMPANAALIVCSAEDLPEELTMGVVKKGNLVLNPKGKTFVCILHEYLQWSQKTKPTYVYRETDNSTNPYCAVVKIDGMEYGTGHGANKKNAKSDAARKTLAVLLSAEDMQKVEAQANSWENMKPLQDNSDVVFFDNIKIDDKRLAELCKRAGLPSPYAILLECLKRNFMMGDTDIKMQTNVIATAKVEVTLTVSKYTAQVIAKNKKFGKQEASQKLLQQLHPNITCWGSILRLYGDGSMVSANERKLEQQSITQLQHKEYSNGPNHQILEKLRRHMQEVHQHREVSKSKTKFKLKNVPLTLNL